MTMADQHRDRSTTNRADWLFPLLAAVAGHLVIFLLFKFNLNFQPVWAIPANEVIILSLTTLPLDGPASRQPGTAAAKPQAPHPKKFTPVVQQRPAPAAPVASTAWPVTQPVAQPAAPDPGKIEDAAAMEALDALASAAAAELTPAQASAAGPGSGSIQTSVPLYHQNSAPVYPDAARRRNSQGTVLLDVLVDPHGRPAQVKLHQSSGFVLLDRSALNAVRQWRFEPARRLGQAVEMWVQVPVRFELK